MSYASLKLEEEVHRVAADIVEFVRIASKGKVGTAMLSMVRVVAATVVESCDTEPELIEALEEVIMVLTSGAQIMWAAKQEKANERSS
jgi:hypothetical protein